MAFPGLRSLRAKSCTPHVIMRESLVLMDAGWMMLDVGWGQWAGGRGCADKGSSMQMQRGQDDPGRSRDWKV